MGCLSLIIRWLLSSGIIALLVWLLPGVHADGFWTIMCFSAAWGIISIFINPIIQIISLPITYWTMGIFYFVINILMVLMTSWIVDEFTIDNFWWGLLFVLIYTVIASIIGMRNREE